MAAKEITIILLPEGSKRVRQIKIPKSLFYFLCMILISAFSLLGYGVYDYYSVKKELPGLYTIKQAYDLQAPQISALSKRIAQINQKMVNYKKFDDKLRIMVNLEAKDNNIQFVGVGGSDPGQADPDEALEKTQIRLMHQSLNHLDTEIAIQTQRKAELCKYLEKQQSVLACTPSIWPAKGWLSSGFGHRISPFTNEREFHKGVDISARLKTPVIAPADGVITSIGRTYGYGNTITISHGYGMKTVYGHLNKFLVKKGDTIKRGDEIALMGNTGRSTGPHLHYEVHLNGVPVNPFRYILN